VTATGSVELEGELAREVERLQGATLEVVGTIDADARRMRVTGYTVVAVGGARPWVGILVEDSGGLGLADGTGSPIPLSLQPKTQERLHRSVGGKVWVLGTKLVSGQLKVQRYGVLRDPPKAQPEAAP